MSPTLAAAVFPVSRRRAGTAWQLVDTYHSTSKSGKGNVVRFAIVRVKWAKATVCNPYGRREAQSRFETHAYISERHKVVDLTCGWPGQVINGDPRSRKKLGDSDPCSHCKAGVVPPGGRWAEQCHGECPGLQFPTSVLPGTRESTSSGTQSADGLEQGNILDLRHRVTRHY